MEQAKVGKKAPYFEVTAYFRGEFMPVKLSDYAGKWLLLCFYPGDFTFVWPTELSAVAAKYDELKELGADVLSISVDSHFVHKIWEEVELTKMIKTDYMPFKMGSDPDGALGSLYGVYNEDAGVDIRGRFIIDPDGVIQAMEVLTPPVGRKIDETIRQIKAFQVVRASKGGEACPAGWEPGKPTLKPGPDLVGKVWKVWQVDE